jgi:hypothetical protein
MCLGGCRIILGPKVSKKLLTDTYISRLIRSPRATKPLIFPPQKQCEGIQTSNAVFKH